MNPYYAAYLKLCIEFQDVTNDNMRFIIWIRQKHAEFRRETKFPNVPANSQYQKYFLSWLYKKYFKKS
jgi:hypothetical protein